jgi:hypothetical protein
MIHCFIFCFICWLASYLHFPRTKHINSLISQMHILYMTNQVTFEVSYTCHQGCKLKPLRDWCPFHGTVELT